jgi:hypothetical protein
MDNIRFIEVPNIEGITTTFVIIDHGNDTFTSMPKSVYDQQQAEQSTPSVIDEA